MTKVKQPAEIPSHEEIAITKSIVEKVIPYCPEAIKGHGKGIKIKLKAKKNDKRSIRIFTFFSSSRCIYCRKSKYQCIICEFGLSLCQWSG